MYYKKCGRELPHFKVKQDKLIFVVFEVNWQTENYW